MPRIREGDSFNQALRRIVRSNEESAEILRQASDALAIFANPSTYEVNELTVLYIADELLLRAKNVQVLHHTLAGDEIVKTMAILMSAARNRDFAEELAIAVVVSKKTDEFAKKLPNIYLAMEQFIHPDFLTKYRERTSDPVPPVKKNVPGAGLDKPSGSGS